MTDDGATALPSKVVGIGLNKTGTKSMRTALEAWGATHCYEYRRAFELHRRGETDAVIDLMGPYTSFEDWPWPLMFEAIDAAFPEARFVLTVRSTPDAWYRSLCAMAVRIGPLDEFEPHIYGASMPQRDRDGHLAYYQDHNERVRAHFADRPEKLLELCWSDADAMARLAAFLGQEPLAVTPHSNAAARRVYAGTNMALAYANLYGLRAARRVRQLIR